MNEPAPSCELVVLQKNYGICKLGSKEPVPAWVDDGDFWSVSRTREELSIICEERLIPSSANAEGGYSCLYVLGPLGLTMVGVWASLTTSLADAGISVFAISTFDTDYLLVREAELPDAIDALRESGHVVQF